MSRLPESAARLIVLIWSHFLTIGLPPDLRSYKLGEIKSDIWEQRTDAALSGRPGIYFAWHLLVRFLIGIPDDLAWRLEKLSRSDTDPIKGHETNRGDRPLEVLSNLFAGNRRWLRRNIVYFAIFTTLVNFGAITIMAIALFGDNQRAVPQLTGNIVFSESRFFSGEFNSDSTPSPILMGSFPKAESPSQDVDLVYAFVMLKIEAGCVDNILLSDWIYRAPAGANLHPAIDQGKVEKIEDKFCQGSSLLYPVYNFPAGSTDKYFFENPLQFGVQFKLS